MTYKIMDCDMSSHNLCNFFMFICFQVLKWWYFVWTLLIKMFNDINMWFKNWFYFDLISQWINFSRKYFDININLMINVVFFICHIIIFCDKIKFKFIISINFNNWFVVTCYIERDEPHHNKWCKFKIFNNTCFVLIYNWRSIINNMNELSMKTYNVNDKLYTLWM